MPGNLACPERSRRDPQIGRFLGVDPLADGGGQEIYSPYAAMGNMPESCVDPNGEYFTYSSRALEAVYNNMRTELNNRMAECQKELAGLDVDSKDEKVQNRATILTLLIAMYSQFNAQLDAMAGDTEVEFHICNNAPSGTAAAETFYNFDEGRVQFNMGGDNPINPTLAHELRHGYGYLVGELVASRYPDQFYDMADEVAGNLAGLLFTSNPSRAVDGSYGIDDFRPATKPGSTYPQLAGKEEQLSVNTPISVFQKYFDNNLINSYLKTSQNINSTVGDALNNINSRTKGKPRYMWGDLLKK